MAFFLFVCLSSLALPPLNGFIGEFLILIGVFQYHHAWASWAASGAVLSAIYLLWSYQRVALGELTNEKNRTLPDASGRERLILVTVALAILFMGVASPLFTHRMQATTDSLVQQTQGRAALPQPPALASGQKMLLAPQSPSQALPMHDGSLASIAPRTVQP
jgi:NADH-quinone oxidoreductase subunit M